MKFTEAWAEVLNQNNTYKICLAVCLVCSSILCITVVRLSVRDPLVIERECFSKSLAPVATKQTFAEVEHFLRFSLSKRFDSDVADSRVFLGEEEYAYRLKEQEELSRKNMRQKVFPSSIKITDKETIVEADRILSVGNIRSNVPFVLNVQVAATSRTPANPYGLILQRVSQVNEAKQ